LPNKGVSADSGGSFPTGGGELGGLIRQFDWSKTSLGPLAAWPQSLKTATDILLRSPVPIVLLWGEDGVMIYNDAYSVSPAAGIRSFSGPRCVRAGPKSPISTTMS
jgi:hypothetical protein